MRLTDHGRLTVADLIDALSDADPDAEIRIAYQPSWPIAASVSSVTSDAEARADDPDDEPRAGGRPEPGVIWLACGALPYDESPYAPRGAWSDE